MGPKKKAPKGKKEKETVEVAAPTPAVVIIPPPAEDCTGITCAADPVCALTVSKTKLLLGHHNGIVTMHPLSAASTEEIVEIAAHRGSIKAMTVIPSYDKTAEDYEEVLITASTDGTLKAHALPSGKWLMTFTGHEGAIESIVINNGTLYSGGADGKLMEWGLATGEMKLGLKCHVGRITGLCIPTVPPPESEEEPPCEDPPPRGVVITASDDTLAKVINPSSKEVLSIMKGESPILSVCYIHPNIFVGCTDGTVKAFDFHSAQNSAIYVGHTDAVNCVYAHNKRLFSCADDTTVRLWSQCSGYGKWKCHHVFKGHTKSVNAVAVDDEGRLFSGGFDCSARAWDRAGVVNYVEQVEKAAREAAPKPPKKTGKEKASPKKKK